MAFSYDVNIASADGDGSFHMYRLKELMKTAGWTVVASGDGLAAFSVGTDVLTNPNTGANGFDNTNAWITLQQAATGAAPYAGSRQFTFQRGAGGGANFGYEWRINYSPGGTANTGAASSTQAPAFTDDVFLAGGGTPASPTFTTIFNGFAANTSITSIAAGAAGENFSFYMTVILDAFPTVVASVIFFDGVTQYVPTETEPFVMVAKLSDLLSGNIEVYTFAKAIFAGPSFEFLKFRGNPGQLRENPINGNVDLIQAYYGRENSQPAPGGYKGVSYLWRWKTANKNTKDTLSVSAPGAKDRIVYSALATFWDGSVPS
jgi:hypothetical protein